MGKHFSAFVLYWQFLAKRNAKKTASKKYKNVFETAFSQKNAKISRENSIGFTKEPLVKC